MLIDNNILKDVTSSSGWVVGKASEDTAILKEDESVMMFDGVATALEYIDTQLNKPKHNKSSSGSGGHAGSFFSYEEAMKTFREDPTSVVRYDPTEMNPTEFQEQGNDLEYDVTGDFIDIGRVLEGVPENFGSLHNGNPRSRRVRLVVGLAQTHYMTPEEVNHRSERVIRLIDALENANVRTEFTVVDSTGCCHTEIIVKRFDEPLTIEDVAVATHIDFFRRMCFRIAEWSDTWQYGYGRADVLKRNVKVLESTLNDELSVYIDGDMRDDIIKERFDKLEKMLETELSEPEPKINLVWVDNGRVGWSELKNA